MDTSKLKSFAQTARRQLLAQVATRLEQVLRADSIETREKKAAIDELGQQIAGSSKQAVIDRVAYTWFNRFCALRFMDVNHYTRIGIVSPVEGFTQPEILQEAKQGVIDAELKVDKGRVLDILSGRLPSSDPQGEAYRLLLVGACNYYHQLMPFLFEPIADYTELLMPDDLLSENSILQGVRDALTPEACQDVEVIGWLYQFYISERKDEVFANLKEGKKIEAKDIPAATQLFTPHWIVRYLVENSLGRLWMLNHPDSKLVKQMDYYIKPEQEETDFLRVASPEEIKVCDPACGSGHMLTYAFDLLVAIYEEQGYDPAHIPSLILQKNLYGIEIDKRAGDLAAFALVMKARARDRRFFSRKLEPNICVLQNVKFTAEEINEYMKVVGNDLLNQDLWVTLKQFEQADNYGSLIQPQIKDVAFIRNRLEEKRVFDNLFLHNTNQKVLLVLKQAEFLAPRYHVVLANPPYMGMGMNNILKAFVSEYYSAVKSDLFSVFMVRNFDLTFPKGYLGYVTPFVWMFLSSYENLRKNILTNKTIVNLVKPSYTSFFASAIVPLVTFVIMNCKEEIQGIYIDLGYLGSAESQPIKLIEAIRNPNCGWLYRASISLFNKIPGSPIVYWASPKLISIFDNTPVDEVTYLREGIHTANNERFLRKWYEVSQNYFTVDARSIQDIDKLGRRWIPYNKGGSWRKWYGNNEYVIGFDYQKRNEMASLKGHVRPSQRLYFLEGGTWSSLSSSNFGIRYYPSGFLFDSKGQVAVGGKFLEVIVQLNTKLFQILAHMIMPTLDYKCGDVKKLPYLEVSAVAVNQLDELLSIAKCDWDSFELSWDFPKNPLLNYVHFTLSESFNALRRNWSEMTNAMMKLEHKNNCIFIEAYGLQDEIFPDMSLEEITLTCNPYYRYGSKKSEAELEALLLADTMKEFISYAVGCMFGRYSLDKPGLILANQGETAQDYRRQIPQPSFPPDDDNVIPILEQGWFGDDITERFKKFLRVSFGDEHYEENLAFIEHAIGRDIRSYFLKDFYNEHVQMYKKRPIYWMFSSPSGSFNALIYMHRYRPDTLSVILNDYLREYVRKLNAHKAQLEEVTLRMGVSQAEKTKATKEINALNKVLAELKEYEDEVLYPLATRQIQIDLDDGVKVNYGKFGKALKRVSGLSE